MVEMNRLRILRALILVKNLCSILGFNKSHGNSPLLSGMIKTHAIQFYALHRNSNVIHQEQVADEWSSMIVLVPVGSAYATRPTADRQRNSQADLNQLSVTQAQFELSCFGPPVRYIPLI